MSFIMVNHCFMLRQIQIHSNTLYKYLNEFIEMRIKTENRARQFKSMIRMLMRFELYKGKNYKLGLDTMTDVDLMHFEEFLRIEHTFFDKLGNCIKHPVHFSFIYSMKSMFFEEYT